MTGWQVDGEPECTCWKVPDSSGTQQSIAWLVRQAWLTVSGGGDSGVDGRPWGTCWAGPRNDRQRHLLVAVTRGVTVVAVPEREIAWIDVPPIEDEVAELCQGLIGNDERLSPEGIVGSFTVGHHEVIQVVMTRERHRCEPGPDPLGTLKLWTREGFTR